MRLFWEIQRMLGAFQDHVFIIIIESRVGVDEISEEYFNDFHLTNEGLKMLKNILMSSNFIKISLKKL